MGATNLNVGLDCDPLNWRSVAAPCGLQVQGCAVSRKSSSLACAPFRQLRDIRRDSPRPIGREQTPLEYGRASLMPARSLQSSRAVFELWTLLLFLPPAVQT